MAFWEHGLRCQLEELEQNPCGLPRLQELRHAPLHPEPELLAKVLELPQELVLPEQKAELDELLQGPVEGPELSREQASQS